jgi:hypothetical protein
MGRMLAFCGDWRWVRFALPGDRRGSGRNLQKEAKRFLNRRQQRQQRIGSDVDGSDAAFCGDWRG